MTLSILRLIGEELRKDRTARVIAQVPVDVATYLFNEKREWLRTLEDKSEVELIIVPNENMQTPEYSIRRVREDEVELPENKQISYLMPTPPAVSEPGTARDKRPPAEVAAVATLLPSTAAPASLSQPAPVSAPPTPETTVQAQVAQPAPGGVIGWFKRLLVGEPAPSVAQASPETQPAAMSATRSTASGTGGTVRDHGARRRDGRRDHSRHRGHGESGARRDRGDRDNRDRDSRGESRGEGARFEGRGEGRGDGRRDGRDSGRSRERSGQRGDREGNRGGDRDSQRAGDRDSTRGEAGRLDAGRGDSGRGEAARGDTTRSEAARGNERDLARAGEPRFDQSGGARPDQSRSELATNEGNSRDEAGNRSPEGSTAPEVNGNVAPGDRPERGERRSRRGRRRGRRGGGGRGEREGGSQPGVLAEGGSSEGFVSEQDSAARPVSDDLFPSESGPGGERVSHGNGGYSRHEPRERDVSSGGQSPEPFRSDPGETATRAPAHESGEHAEPKSAAHFEPSPPQTAPANAGGTPAATGGQSKPFVVWSSAPSSPSGDRSREE
jgi:ribonuclease E